MLSRSLTVRLWRSEPRRVVVATCPEAGLPVCTHAYMTPGELHRLGRRRVTFFCAACKHVHLMERAQLRLS